MEEKKYIVYLHVNKINGKVYVGITKYDDPNRRWRNGREYRRNVLFTRVINKYGWDGFNHIVIFKNLPEEAASRIETLLIKRYRKRGICYNIADGGQGTSAMNDIIRKKISKSCIGRNTGDDNPMRHLTEEQRKFHSDKMKSLWENRREELLSKLRSGIARGKQLGRYKGSHHGQSGQGLSNIIKAASKPVQCFDINGNLIREYESIKQAAMELGKSYSNLTRACKTNKKAYGFIWKYKERG